MINNTFANQLSKIGTARSVPPPRLALHLHLCRPQGRERLSSISPGWIEIF